jgi:hypothetical protein
MMYHLELTTKFYSSILFRFFPLGNILLEINVYLFGAVQGGDTVNFSKAESDPETKAGELFVQDLLILGLTCKDDGETISAFVKRLP